MAQYPRVALCLGDGGNVELFLPIIPALRDSCYLSILVDPKSAGLKLLEKNKIEHTVTNGADVDWASFKLIVTGTNGKVFDLWIAATENGEDFDIPVLWCGDFEGSGCEEKVKRLIPTWITALNKYSKERLVQVRPDVRPTDIFVTGNPAFDELHKMAAFAPNFAERVRNRLGIGENPFVFYAASSSAQFELVEESLLPTLTWAKMRGVRFLADFHPADPKRDALRALVKDELGVLLVEDNDMHSKMELALASNVMVTDYSTVGYKAALVGATVAFIMGPSARKYQESRGMVPPYFSILDRERGVGGIPVALPIFDPEDIGLGLDTLMREPHYRELMSNARNKGEFSGMIDGKAGERVKNLIETLVRS